MGDGLTGFYRALFDAANDAMFVADAATGEIIDANRRASELIGRSLEEIRGMHQTRLHPPGDAERYAGIFAQHLKDGKAVSQEVFVLHADGRRVPVEISASVVKWGDRGVVLGIFRDLSARRRIQTELREERDRIKSYLDVVEVMIVALNRHGEIILMNRKGCQILGYEEGFLRGKNWFRNCLPGEMQEPVFEVFKRIMAGEKGPLEFYENPVVTASGETRMMAWHNAILKDAEGRILGTLSSGEDITQKRRAERALRESEEKLHAMVHSIQDHMSLIDRDLNVVWANEAAIKVFGKDIIGRKCFEAYHHKTEPCEPSPCLTKLAFEDGKVHTHETRVVDREGKTVHFHCTASVAVCDEKGSPTAVIEISRDITDRVEAEQEREALIRRQVSLIRELEEKNIELERYTYTVSHDLKAPIITIKGFLGLLVRDLEKGDKGKAISRIARINGATDKMHRMLAELLDLSRSGRLVDSKEEVQLGGLAREAADLVAGTAPNSELAVIIAADLPTVFGDRTRLFEVLHNLIDNGFKFASDNARPTVEIGARREGGETVVYVRDNGIGIDPRYSDKIFGLFEKLDQSTEGSGVGLAIVKRIIEVHGGRIWLESNGPGQGSTFCFTLQKKQNEAL